MFLLETHVEGVGDVVAKVLLGAHVFTGDGGLFGL
jgi:hypothetical protein